MATQSNYRRIQECPFIVDLATILGTPENPTRAKRVLCAFFYTFREHIAPIASSSLIAHLPIEIKQIYRDGWKRKVAKDFDYDAFIEALYRYRGMEHAKLFSSKTEAQESVVMIFEVVKMYLSESQYSVMMSLMPLLFRINLSADYRFDEQNYFL